MSTTRNSRALPIAVILAIAAFAGCQPYRYYGDADVYTASERLNIPAAYERPDSVYVRILGVRRPREDGDLRVDVLISGDHAFDAARQWLTAPASGGTANAVITLRRTTPDATPINLTFAGDRITGTPLAIDGRELDRGLNASDRRIMLTFILDASPGFKPGSYEAALAVPRAENARPWDVGPLDIALETQPLTVQMFDTSRVD